MWQPPRGTLPGDAAGQQLLQLGTLQNLKQLQLRGQCELSADLMQQLAAHWHSLTALDLCCVLPDGTQGLQHFTALRSLKLRPYKWDGELMVSVGAARNQSIHACSALSLDAPRSREVVPGGHEGGLQPVSLDSSSLWDIV